MIRSVVLKRVAIVLAVVAGLALAGFLVYSHLAKQDEQAFESTVTRADKLIQQDRLDETASVYREYLDKTLFRKHKDEIEIRLAEIHAAQGRPGEALAIYRRLEAQGNTSYSVIIGIATNARLSGDKQLAREYYLKAIERQKASHGHGSSMDIRRLEEIMAGMDKPE